MPTIAVIQNGTELARQKYADVADSFAQCCRLLSADGVRFTMKDFSDEATGFLFANLHRAQFHCLVFASNSLQSVEIERALVQNRDEVNSYIASGGGIVILHQLIPSYAALLPDRFLADLVSRHGTPAAQCARVDAHLDVLLNYPLTVPPDTVRDIADRAGPPGFYYQKLTARSLPETLQPVLSAPDGDPVLVRSHDHAVERIVVATMPLDWQSSVDLLANAIRYACLGQPRRMVWRPPDETRSERLVRWLATDGLTSIRAAPRPGADLDPVAAWLLTRVDVLVVPADGLADARSRAEVKAYLSSGGTVVTADGEAELESSRVNALVGQHSSRMLAVRLYGELAAVDGWRQVDFAFELRNVAAALTYLWGSVQPRSAAAIPSDVLHGLTREIRRRLRDPEHRQDMSSSIALVQTLAFLGGVDAADRDTVEWLCTDPRARATDVRSQVRAARAGALREPDRELLADAAASFDSSGSAPATLAGVVRMLDSIAFLDQLDLLPDDAPSATRVARAVCAQLEANAPDPEVGWISVEATSDVVRGLLALEKRCSPDVADVRARIAVLVATGAGALGRALDRYRRADAKVVAWYARIVHALVQTESAYPLGLQRLASLAWPGRAAEESDASTDIALLEHLAAQNKSLRDKEREQEKMLAQEQRAARVGRGVATVLPTVVILGLLSWLLYAVGALSPLAIIANVAVILTVLLGVVTILFGLLERWHLLAGPASRVQQWVQKAVPLLSDLGKIKGR